MIVHPAPTIDTYAPDADKTGMHLSGVIVDDLQSLNNVGSVALRDKIWDYYRLLTPILDEGAWLIMCCTRWHLDDIVGRIKRDRKLAAKYRFFERKALDGDRPVFPKKLKREFLDEQKNELGSYLFSAQYQNDPVPDENRVFKPEWITGNYYATLPDRKETTRIMTIDPAISESRSAAYTAIVIVDHLKSGDMYVLPPRRGHWLPEETVNQICKAIDDFQPDRWGIEEVLFQKVFKIWIEREFNRLGIHCPTYKLKTASNISKEMRIERLQPVAERNQLHIHANMRDLELEILEYPQSKTRDMLDALAYHLDMSPIVRYTKPDPEKTWEQMLLLDPEPGQGRNRPPRHFMEM